MRKTSLLRRAIFDPEILLLPVAHDALSAVVTERVGFRAVFAAGYANSASLLGRPDVQLLSMSEMVDAAARIVDAVDIPVFTDADNGYGGPLNTARAVRLYEKAGVAGLFLEDQTLPKRCGHMQGKSVVPPREMIAKIKAAVDTRHDRDFVLMARTDALAVHGLDDALDRMHQYIEAGADVAFVEAPATVEQMRQIVAALSVPVMANMIPGGATPLLTAAELQALGFACVAYPTVATYAVARTLVDVLGALRRDGDVAALADRLLRFEEFNEMVGLSRLRDLEARYYGESERVAPPGLS
jgi:methylisocitrate lyase